MYYISNNILINIKMNTINVDDCICQLRLPMHASYHIKLALHKKNVYAIKHLLKKTPEELIGWSGMGPKYVEYIQNSLRHFGLSLGLTDEQIEKYRTFGPYGE